MSLLSVEDIRLSFGGVVALDGVSLNVPSGAVHSLIGPNGAGKTTLFNVITGIYSPTGGSLRLAGRDVLRLDPSDRAALGLSRTFQNLQIFFNMSALENVMVGGHMHSDISLLSALFRLRGLDCAERAAADGARALMTEVGLERYVGSATTDMPYGALKRLEIARALASRPKLLLLDEPAAGLNPAEARDMVGLIRRIAGRGVTVLLVEHNMRLVMEVSDHVFVMNRGRLLSEGTPREICADQHVARAYLGSRSAERQVRAYA